MGVGRLREIVNSSYKRLQSRINGGLIKVENEASLQLQLASILKTIGELYVSTKKEVFLIELEKPVILSKGCFLKSGSDKAKIDIFISIEDDRNTQSCALELKFFKKANQREPNNRYDIFKDIHNLECYEQADFGLLIVATDHPHYVNQTLYSKDTAAFDFRHGKRYRSGTKLIYGTKNPYGEPITLKQSYKFEWDQVSTGLHFLKLEVLKCNKK